MTVCVLCVVVSVVAIMVYVLYVHMMWVYSVSHMSAYIICVVSPIHVIQVHSCFMWCVAGLMSVYGCCIYVFSVLSMLSEVYGVIIVCISFVFPCDVSLSWHVIVWVCHVCVWMGMYGSCPDDGMCRSICVYDVLYIAYEYNVCHMCTYMFC